ncbi:hypothetical protein [Yersinia bercovieri]|uniref:hypothetical protein n=3 Tax=Yersinia bercovieri TaxID=634 RepID=UPI0005E2DEDA|nr:hypothetical protein [Yersinia bercovieri]CFQ31396.1 Uncharacterised protein [Yersinia bercovieri]CNE75080.1 Uncharacterised protein [Yersinia bercovieri]
MADSNLTLTTNHRLLNIISRDTNIIFFNNVVHFINGLDIRQLDVLVGTLNSSARTFRLLKKYAGGNADAQKILDNMYGGIISHMFEPRGSANYKYYIYDPITSVISFFSHNLRECLPSSISNVLFYFCGDIYQTYTRINENTLLNTFPQAVSIGSGLASNLLATVTHDYNKDSSTATPAAPTGNTTFIIDSAFKASVAVWFVMSALSNTAKSYYTYNETRLKMLGDIASLRQSGIKFFNDINEKYSSKDDVLLDLINHHNDYINYKEPLSRILNSTLYVPDNAGTYQLDMDKAFYLGGVDYTYEQAKIWEALLIMATTHTVPAARNQTRSQIPRPVVIPQNVSPHRPRASTLGVRPAWR